MSAPEPTSTGLGLDRRIERRVAIRWMLTAAASLPLAQIRLRGDPHAPIDTKGYGTDPELAKTYNPGEVWPLTLSAAQRRTATALCDVIIPADAESPSASSVGVVDFIDEWVSAPYPQQRTDRPIILEGLTWIEEESQKRFSKDFPNLSPTEQTAICDDVCFEPNAKSSFKKAARFFARFRDLTAGGFYTTPEGMNDLKYIGNTPLATFDGPPPEVIRRVGLA